MSSNEKTSPQALIFRNIPAKAFKVVAVVVLLLAIVIAATAYLCPDIAIGIGYSLLYIVILAQPLGLFFRNRPQTEMTNRNLGCAILILALPLAVLLGFYSHSIPEAVSFMLVPVSMFLQGLMTPSNTTD